jgi:hypothetical protein
MKKAGRRYPPLRGIHLTPAPFLPPPSATFPGWVRSSPYDYLVHPQAVQSLVLEIKKSLAPGQVVFVGPDEVARVALAHARKSSAEQPGQ